MIDRDKLNERIDAAYKKVERHRHRREWGWIHEEHEKYKIWMRLISVSTALSAVTKAQHNLDYEIRRTGFMEE